MALHSLKEQFAGKVKLIYIDPPYNTGNDAFAYNDRFNHSTWLTFIKNRLEVAKEFLREDGIAMISCDDNEQAYLKVFMDTIFGRENFIANVAVVTNLAGNNDKFGFSGTHEYLLVYAKNKSILTMNELSIDDDSLEEWSFDEIGYWKKGSSLQMTGEASNREDRPNLYYPIYVSKDGERVSTVKKNGWDVVYPKSGNVDKRWRWSKNRLEEQNEEVLISGTSPVWKLYKKQRPQFGELPTKRPKSVMYKPSYSYSYSAKELKDLFGKKVFSYSKSTELLSDFIEISTDEGDIIMDFFSGSGTTGSSILKLNKMKNSNRQFILVEQLSKDSNIGLERLSLEIKKFTYKNSFIYFELAEYNEEAKNKIDARKSYKELKKLFTELTDYYFLNYNVSVKQFNDQLLDDEDFQELPLEEQKTLFKALLDNNQLYVPYKEQEDSKYNLSKEDQELTNDFYG